jgi:hypothetical protein
MGEFSSPKVSTISGRHASSSPESRKRELGIEVLLTSTRSASLSANSSLM